MFTSSKIDQYRKYLSIMLTYKELSEIINTIDKMEEIIQIYASMDTYDDWGKEAQEFLEKYRK